MKVMMMTEKKISPVLQKIKEESESLYKDIKKEKLPTLTTPLRSLSNVTYDEKKGYFELAGAHKTRTLTANTIKTFAQTLRMMELSKLLVETDDMATKRDAYYQSKNWSEARFNEQPESDAVMDDMEALFGVNREQLGFYPDERGGDIAGALTVIDEDPETKKEIKIDCTKFGSGSYSVPSNVEQLQFETKAKFILAIETQGMYSRLVKHAYWKKQNCILVSMGGVPTRATRRFIRRLADDKKIPVYAFSVAGDETLWYEDETGMVCFTTFDDFAKDKQFKKVRTIIENERSDLYNIYSTAFDAEEGTKRERIRTLIRHPHYENMYEIRTEQGFSVKTTASHSITIFDSERKCFTEKTPETINKDVDYAIVSLDIPNKEHLTMIDLAQHIPSHPSLQIEEKFIVNKRSKTRIPRYITKENMSSFVRLLGYYVAEGHAEEYKIGFSFHVEETSYILDVKEILETILLQKTVVTRPHTTEKQIICCNTLLSQLMVALCGKGAGKKKVPNIIYNVPDECKKEFLKGYYRGDGRVDYTKENSSVELWAKTVSKTLSYGLIGIIAQLGGLATLQHPKFSEEPHTVTIETPVGTKLQLIQSRQQCYLVSVANKNTLSLLKDIVLELNPTVQEHLLSSHMKTSKLDSLPKEIIEPYRQFFREVARGNMEEILPPAVYQSSRISKEKLRELFDAQPVLKNLTLLHSLIQGKTTLVKIKSVEEQPRDGEYVYDLEMEDTHRFYTNFLSVHNTDGDPYGWLNIYRTLKVGSGNAAHLNKFFCVPQAKFFGITAKDITEYKLPTHPLKDIDVKRVEDGMKNDPFVKHYKEWQNALHDIIKLKKRAEQQALAAHGLNYVISDYLPAKLENPKSWLP